MQILSIAVSMIELMNRTPGARGNSISTGTVMLGFSPSVALGSGTKGERINKAGARVHPLHLLRNRRGQKD